MGEPKINTSLPGTQEKIYCTLYESFYMTSCMYFKVNFISKSFVTHSRVKYNLSIMSFHMDFKTNIIREHFAAYFTHNCNLSSMSPHVNIQVIFFGEAFFLYIIHQN